ncbi:MAG: polyisoprenoid-binding protein [Aeromicrobium sp.]|jgi:polyisoprenoid-binding protein YceI|uniref:YceI family protein n=1 Tax=Aeromicrobium sp. TaxID=1871063 RepID=UPI002628F4B5|nr:YceI family protein [Aeromicrobium sp.]MCW2789478.1 polyisoprenoid-binding protein [Aeromicrobium sp.]MCW2823128.1 polyisoprenoid-binding protein [Aeromicrobium sp.]
MSTSTVVSTGTWVLDPSHTEIGFTVRHLVSKVRGKFETFEGTIVSAEDVTASTVNVSIDLASVNTGTADRDAHLRSGDFFNAEENPKMTFVSTGIVHKGDSDFVVTGDLTIKGVTKSVELVTEFLGEGGDPWGGTRVGLEATTQISRKEFGIDFNIPVEGADKLMIGDKITINIVAEAVLQA